jgi:hypothetical protein
VPWDNSSLQAGFYFQPFASSPVPAAVVAFAASHGIPLPRGVEQRQLFRDQGPYGVLVGAWVGSWGGNGRWTMLIISSVNESDGTADVIHAVGPPTARSLHNSAGFETRVANIHDGMLELTTRGGFTLPSAQFLAIGWQGSGIAPGWSTIA